MGGNNFKLTDQKDWGISSLSVGGGKGGGVKWGSGERWRAEGHILPFVICK